MAEVDFYCLVYGRLYKMTPATDPIEEQPPQAGMVQPVVGPPDAGPLSEEPGALARRQIIAEIETFIKYEMKSRCPSSWTEDYRLGYADGFNVIAQYLESSTGTKGQDAP